MSEHIVSYEGKITATKKLIWFPSLKRMKAFSDNVFKGYVQAGENWTENDFYAYVERMKLIYKD